jgi:transposase
MEKIGIPELLETHFEAHGNWVGTGIGWTTAVWMAHILSQGDHRLSWAEKWVGERVETLECSTGGLVLATEWSDERLGILLDLLSEEEPWQEFESALNRRTIRLYDLKRARVHLDNTTVSGHWEVTKDGLFQFGHSKDHRPDLPQRKVMLSTLDPLGRPVATQAVSGEKADDPLYVPAIKQVRDSLDASGLKYMERSTIYYLKQKGWSNLAIAEAVGCHQNNVGRILREPVDYVHLHQYSIDLFAPTCTRASSYQRTDETDGH